MLLRDGVYVSSSFARTYLVDDGNTAVLIDTGTAMDIAPILAEYESDGVDLSRLKAVFLTHFHNDHAGGASHVRATFDCPVVAHKLDSPVIRRADPLSTAADMAWMGVKLPATPCPVDLEVEEGDELLVGSLKFTVYHLPGHTPGGVGYLWNGFLFSGDTLFTHGGIGWDDVHWGSFLEDHESSIRRMAEIDFETLCAGHGEPGPLTEEAVRTGLAGVEHIVLAHQPPKIGTPAARRPVSDKTSTLVIDGIPDVKPSTTPPDQDIRSQAMYEFSCGRLLGHIRPLGHNHGLIIRTADGHPVTSPGACTMNLEHWCEPGRCGKFTPRNEMLQWYDAEATRLTIHFAPVPEWKVTAHVSYDLSGKDQIDIEFVFDIDADYPNFEAFIASYFWGRQLPYVWTVEDGLVQPSIENGQQLFFPKGLSEGDQVEDGRWDFLKSVGLFAENDARRYRYPITFHHKPGDEWGILQMVDPDMCSAVSINTFAYAQDFSLVGRDVKKGEQVRIRARVAYIEVDGTDGVNLESDVEKVVGQFLKELSVS